MGNQQSGGQGRQPYPRRSIPPPHAARSGGTAGPAPTNVNPLTSPTANTVVNGAIETQSTQDELRSPSQDNSRHDRGDSAKPPRRVSLVTPTPGDADAAQARRPSDAAKSNHSGSQNGTSEKRKASTTPSSTAEGRGRGAPAAQLSRPKLPVPEAKELFQNIFSPKQGELEVIVSGFLQLSDYQAIGVCVSQFLANDMRDRWYLDTPMLAVLGRDRWRSTRNSAETAWPIKPNKQQVRNLIRQRREFTDQLRERLMRASGAAAEAENMNHRYSLQNLLRTYKHTDDAVSRESVSTGAAEQGLSEDGAPGRSGASAQAGAAGKPASLLFQTDSTVSSLASSFTQPSDGLYVTRLRTTVTTSFDCYALVAKRIPPSVINAFFRDYLLIHVPINDPRLAYEEKRVGDLNKLSFFVSMQNRARLLQGLSQKHTDTHQDLASSADVTLAATTKNYEEYFFLQTFKKLEKHGSATSPVKIENGAELFTALRNLAMIITTASSSMVLDTLFNLAEVIKSRQRFRELRQDAADRGVALESIIGADKAAVRPYLGVPGDNLSEWKRWTTTEEMSLPTFTRLVLQRFRTDNEAKIQKLRKSFPTLFAILDKHLLQGDRDVDATRILTNAALKIMFLVGGGQRSIEADDRRVPMGARHCTDDMTLSRALEVPVLNRICWVGSMLSMPMMTSRGLLIQERRGRPLTFAEAEECTVVMRELFIAVGALPSGKYCPSKFVEWLPLFPLHAVNTEGKRILMYLYMTQYTAIRPLTIPIQKDMVLLSLAKRLATCPKFDRKSVCSYLFQPVFSVGFEDDDDNREEVEASKAMRRQRRATEKHSISVADGEYGLAMTPEETSMGYDYGFAESSCSGGTGSATPASRSVKPATRQAIPDAPGARRAPAAKAEKTRDLEEDSDTSASSFSTLMESGLDIDVYTCVSLQNQLYLRCANESTVRRHKMTELTPCVTTQFFPGEEALMQGRKDIAPTLLKRVPALMPSEAVVLIRWKDNEPRVTVHEGDYLSVMVERQRESTSGIYFRHRGSSTITAPQRSQSIVSVEDPRAAPGDRHDLLRAMNAGGTGTEDAKLDNDEGSSSYSLFGTSTNSSFAFDMEGMGGLLGVENTSSSRRYGMRWQVSSVHPIKQLLPLSERARIKQDNHGELPEDLALVVSCPTTPLTEPLRIITIGHERSFMSPLTLLGEGNDACWSNPQLMLATVTEENDSLATGSGRGTPSLAASMTSVSSTTHSAFCRTEEELQRVFYALGVLLANTIANGVYLNVPFAPLAFSLFKKAVQSGDYNFRSFTWLEPCEGNLLSPAFVLNSAYEVMCMTDGEYFNFLSSKGLADPANLVFPVFKDLEQEREEDRQALGASGHDVPHPPASPSTGTGSGDQKAFRRQQFSQDAGKDGVSAAVPESAVSARGQRRRRSSIQQYLNAIERQNASGTAFSDNSRTPTGPSSATSPLAATLNARIELSLSSAGGPNLDGLQDILRQLPSREEYISLYLVNDLAWSSVRKNGYGHQTKGLWVWLAKGFMTSPLAKSPLLLHCCSRVVKEVLCMGTN